MWVRWLPAPGGGTRAAVLFVASIAVLGGCGGNFGATEDAGTEAESACRASLEDLAAETGPMLTDVTRSGTGPWTIAGELAGQGDGADNSWTCEIRLDDDAVFRGELQLAWCGDDTLTGREAYRLIRGVTDRGEHSTGGHDDQDEDSGEDAPASAGPVESMPA